MLNIEALKDFKKSQGKILISFCFFLFSLTLMFLKGSFPFYLPLMLSLGLVAIYLFRNVGFLISLALLLPFIGYFFIQKDFWAMALLYTFGGDFFLALNAFEEGPDAFSCQEKEKEAFQEMLDKLKEEAQRRYLEKTALEEHVGRLLSEKAFWEESYSMKEKTLLGKVQEEKRTFEEKAEKEKALLRSLQEEKRSLEEKGEKEKALLRSLQEEKRSLEEKGEKDKALLRSLQEEKRSLEEKGEKEKALLRSLQEEKQALEDKLGKVQEEKRSLEEKEKTLLLSSNSQNIEKKLARSEGLYKQLKEQFTEKSKILDATRKELFQTQGKFQAIEREWALFNLEENNVFKMMDELSKKYAFALEEIASLECLITQLL